MPTPSLPPYGYVDPPTLQCIANASVQYTVPELLLHSILLTENGIPGKCSRNKNGTLDCGLTQINSSHYPSLLSKYGITPSQIAYDNCTNVTISAYIIKTNYLKKQQDWTKAIIAYNIGPYATNPSTIKIGQIYASKVITRWHQLYSYSQQYTRATP